MDGNIDTQLLEYTRTLNVTFYKGCIVNNTYSEVFDVFNRNATTNTTCFEDYLTTLESVTISLEDVYLASNGTLTIDPTAFPQLSDFMEFNYMHLNSHKFGEKDIDTYVFIDDFRLINGLIIFDYSLDVWHTYAHLMTLRTSVLENCTIPTPQSQPPIPYASLLPPVETDIDGYFSIYSRPEYCTILVELSAYTTTTPDQIGSRQNYICAATYFNQNGDKTKPQITNIKDGACLIENVEDRINHLIAGIPVNRIGYGNSTEQKVNFTIENIYLIPDSYGFSSLPQWTNIELLAQTAQDYVYAGTEEGQVKFIDNGFKFWNVTKAYQNYIHTLNNPPYITVFDVDILTTKSADDIEKGYLLGNLSRQISMGRNRLTQHIKMTFEASQNSVALKLILGDSIIDMSEDYQYISPIASMTYEAFEARRISYELEKYNAKLNIASQAIGIYTTGMQGAQDAALGAAYITTGNNFKGASKIMQASQTPFNIAQQGLKLGQGVAALKTLELPLTPTGEVSQSKSIVISNVKIGLKAWFPQVSLDGKTDNFDLYSNAIRNLGYAQTTFVDQNIFVVDDIDSSKIGRYDVFKFRYVKLSGLFAQSIKTILSDILLNGFKLWKTKTPREIIVKS